MRASQFLGVFFCILLIGFVLNLASCGGSNLNNPVSDVNTETEGGETSDDIVELTRNQDIEEPEQITDLDVTITVTQKTVKPGEETELTAFGERG